MKQKSGDQEKPGLLEYLEDIIGSNQYQEQIDKMIEKRKGSHVKVVEMEIEKLNKQMQRQNYIN
ncbi:unnamed protein product [Paramecium sonneborni]|uniref:Uncharacterized protein n=1 Tax=Paramecium sonneborni TaxID=65129 RepID=A0A8S1MF16_9CILI|nr:unnamed protein product [Paramecium sonneborni]